MEIKVESIVRRFGKATAVDGLSFEFGSGMIFAFVGPNGAGKTTTMRIMSTLDQSDEGDVYLDGVSATQYPERVRRMLGFMPDALPGHRDIVVHEYIDFFARAYGIRRTARRKTIAALEEFVGLESMRNKQLRSLSKGMKQRVSLARALVHDPPLLILDEPAAGLDPRARIELRDLLVALADRGKAILISSHILNELEAMSHGAVIIERGRLVRAGTMEDLHHHAAPAASNGAAQAHGVTIRALERDPAAMLTAVREYPGVVEARTSRSLVEAELSGGPEAAAALLAHLVQSGHQVVEYRPTNSGLERLFMDVTKGEVQ